MQKAVFLDLDGVVFQLVDHFGEYGVSARNKEEIKIVDDLAKDLDNLLKKEFLILAITNQPDVARKKITPQFLRKKHKLLQDKYPQISKVYTCCHTETDLCNCRKPKTGLFLQAAQELKIDFSQSWVVGDSRSDIEAGCLVHAKTIFIQTKYNCGDQAISICTAVSQNVKRALQLILDVENKTTNLSDA